MSIFNVHRQRGKLAGFRCRTHTQIRVWMETSVSWESKVVGTFTAVMREGAFTMAGSWRFQPERKGNHCARCFHGRCRSSPRRDKEWLVKNSDQFLESLAEQWAGRVLRHRKVWYPQVHTSICYSSPSDICLWI